MVTELRAVFHVSEILVINVDRGDPDGTKLRTILNAQFAYERSQAVRWRWLWLSVSTFVMTWLIAHFGRGVGGSLIPASLPAFIGATRILVCARTTLAVVSEWQCYRSWVRAIADHRGAELSVSPS